MKNLFNSETAALLYKHSTVISLSLLVVLWIMDRLVSRKEARLQ